MSHDNGRQAELNLMLCTACGHPVTAATLARAGFPVPALGGGGGGGRCGGVKSIDF